MMQSVLWNMLFHVISGCFCNVSSNAIHTMKHNDCIAFFFFSPQSCHDCGLNSVWATISFNVKCKIDSYLHKGTPLADNALFFLSWTMLSILGSINVMVMQIYTWKSGNTVCLLFGQNPKKWKYSSLYLKFQNKSGLLTAAIRVILVSPIPWTPHSALPIFLLPQRREVLNKYS